MLGAVAAAARAPWPRTPAGWRDGLVAGVLLHGLYLGGVFWAVKHGLPAGIAALVAGLQPLATGLLVGPLLGERVSAAALARDRDRLPGRGPRRRCRSSARPTGSRHCRSSSASSACSSITLGTIWQKRTGGAVDLRTNAVVQYLGAAAVTLPLALLTEQGRLDPAPELWIGLAWAVFGLSIGAIGLLLFLIRRGAVAGVAALLYLVPPVSALMAYRPVRRDPEPGPDRRDGRRGRSASRMASRG